MFTQSHRYRARTQSPSSANSDSNGQCRETLRLEAPLVINVQLSIRPDQGNGRHNTPSDCGDTTGEPEVAKLGLRSAAASPT